MRFRNLKIILAVCLMVFILVVGNIVVFGLVITKVDVAPTENKTSLMAVSETQTRKEVPAEQPNKSVNSTPPPSVPVRDPTPPSTSTTRVTHTQRTRAS